MGKRLTDREKLALKISTLSDNEIAELLDYISVMESMKAQQTAPELFEDELLAVLADATENQRARQVWEWDRIRRKTDQSASQAFSRRWV